MTLDWKVAATASVRQKGDYLELAARPGALWSGIYFVDDGYAKSDDEALGGECELADPRGALPAMVAPQYAFRMPGGVTAGQSEIDPPVHGHVPALSVLAAARRAPVRRHGPAHRRRIRSVAAVK